MPPVRLLKFVTGFAIGGTERQVVNLARSLDPATFELHVACLKRSGHFLGEIEALGATLTEYRIERLYGYRALRQQLRFARYLRRHTIQVVHTYNFYPTVFAVPTARLAGVPLIIASIRDTGVYLTAMQRRVQRVACRMADHILANAEAVRQWLIADGHDPEKIAVIRNGIDLSRFADVRGDGWLHRELGLPPHAPIVALLSRLHPLKGVEYFLAAAALVAHRFPEARFVVVGEGGFAKDTVVVPDAAYRRQLEGCVRGLGLEGRVLLTGFRLDVPEVLSEVTVSVLPSLSEGLSNTLLESMAAGVPVVGTTVGGNPEIVEHGETGLLVPPRDSVALAHAIGRVLESPELAARLGRAGRRRVGEHFSLERMVRETERVYLSRQEPAQEPLIPMEASHSRRDT